MKIAAFFFACLVVSSSWANGFKYKCWLVVSDESGNTESSMTIFDSATQTEVRGISVGEYGFTVLKRNLDAHGESIFIRIEPERGGVVAEAQMGAPWLSLAYLNSNEAAKKMQSQVYCELIKEPTTPAETP